MVPVGVLVAKKLRLDPITGAAISLAGTLTGFACSPGGSYMAQGLMDVPLYSGYTERVVILMITAVVGAIFLLLCDTLSRLLFAPYELPVGILLSFLGAPFFLWLLLGRKRRLAL